MRIFFNNIIIFILLSLSFSAYAELASSSPEHASSIIHTNKCSFHYGKKLFFELNHHNEPSLISLEEAKKRKDCPRKRYYGDIEKAYHRIGESLYSEEEDQQHQMLLEYFRQNISTNIKEQLCNNDDKTRCIKSTNGKFFEVSIVNSEEARLLFEFLLDQEHMPYKYVREGCPNRSNEIARLLYYGRNIKAGHLLITGDLEPHIEGKTVSWGMHVAPFLYMENGEKLILDPSLNNRPLSENEWKSTMNVSGDKIETELLLKQVFTFDTESETETTLDFSFNEISEEVLFLFFKLNRKGLDYYKALELIEASLK